MYFLLSFFFDGKHSINLTRISFNKPIQKLQFRLLKVQIDKSRMLNKTNIITYNAIWFLTYPSSVVV